jgi:hypothetical protein
VSLFQRPMRIPVPGLTRSVPAGDALAKLTSHMGVKPCPPCEARRRAMNSRVVFIPRRIA